MLLQRPGSISPLYFCGPPGTGKTHLLEGIWTAVRQRRDFRGVVYLTAEQFTTFFLEALNGSGLPSFRRKYRGVDVLLVDDVQFFAGKRATVTEFQYTIDSILREGKQLVLSADRRPGELQSLGTELITRMSGGLVCQLDYPDRATRLAILRQLAKARGLDLPNDVIKLIAHELVGDARQLSGALNRLEATSTALAKPITVELATSALEDLFQAQARVVRIVDVEQAVCDVFGLEKDALKSHRKAKAVTQPRMLAMWLSRKYTRAALSEISHYFGRRSHSSVILAQQTVNNWVSDGTAVAGRTGPINIEDAIRRVELKLRTG
jgi:chromosomal replication initiator protein